MRVISRRALREYWERHSEAEQPLIVWFKQITAVNWKNHHELKSRFPDASILPNSRIVFNISGNRFRLVVEINYEYQGVWIRFIGTHSEYDKIDASKI